MGILVEPLDLRLLLGAATLRRECGLMTNDSLIVATMKARGIDQLASADQDFGAVPGIGLFRPSDLV